MLEGKYFNDLEDGFWTYWYENGQIKEEISWVDGNLFGKNIQWDEDGKITFEYTFD